MGLNQNTWTLNNWYDQDVAGNVSYSGPGDPGSLWAWGQNNNGDLAQGNTTDPRSSPVQIGSETNWLVIACGQTKGGIKTDGTLWSWGYNQGGQLGQNSRTSRSSPIQIPGTTWKTVSLSFPSLATKTDGTLWTWGHDINGSLGINEEGERYSSPVQIPGTDWDVVIEGNNHGQGAIKTDGTLWVWGNNHRGQLGQNNLTKRSSPVQIPGDWKVSSYVSYVSCSYSTTNAIKSDGTLWGWGDNEYGETGDNSNTIRSSPVQIGSDTTWKQVNQRGGRGMAVKTDGTLWGWGTNSFGALGLNDDNKYSSPVQVGSGTDWDLVVQGNDFSLATKTDGTLWASGIQEVGQLGNNVGGTSVCLSSPVQIPGTDWMLANTIYTGSIKTGLVRQQI
tara:strand:+ start:23 stop:1192 length:1170 start_codon:yes stop_codon:yes gene_type:complete